MKMGYTSTRSSFEDAEDHAGNSTVAFTIREGRLFTLRERELPAFRLYRMRVRNQTLVDGNAYELLLDLFETKIEQLADEIENIYSDLEKLSRVIMEGHQGDEYDEALSTLAELEDIGWKVRLCLMDTQRALNFWCVRRACRRASWNRRGRSCAISDPCCRTTNHCSRR